jgi:hypothetical protein
MKHLLFSQDKDMPIKWFDKFSHEAIKQAIIEHLKVNPNDCIEHCKEYSKHDLNKYLGYEILNFYKINPKTQKISKAVTKRGKEYFIKIEK